MTSFLRVFFCTFGHISAVMITVVVKYLSIYLFINLLIAENYLEMQNAAHHFFYE